MNTSLLPFSPEEVHALKGVILQELIEKVQLEYGLQAFILLGQDRLTIAKGPLQGYALLSSPAELEIMREFENIRAVVTWMKTKPHENQMPLSVEKAD